MCVDDQSIRLQGLSLMICQELASSLCYTIFKFNDL